MASYSFSASVNEAKEIAEIARDFASPIEIIREALHNSYDAGAKTLKIVCRAEIVKDGRRVLTVEIIDDGVGMDKSQLEGFFGLGHSKKEKFTDRKEIGYKGHGTKIYYQAQETWVLTNRNGGEVLLAHLPSARSQIYNNETPRPTVYVGDEARAKAQEATLELPLKHGTTIRLVDYTPNSERLIPEFRQQQLHNYVHWYTVFGSFEHVVRAQSSSAPMRLFLQGTEEDVPKEILFGHPWPATDMTDLKKLKEKDPRRPFNYFQKTFRRQNYPTRGSYRIDIAVIVEGSRARGDRDTCIRSQGRTKALYREEERYGLWLCKDYIPIEKRFEWLSEEDCPTMIAEIPSGRVHVLVNCQQFSLTANRGSVGNSSAELINDVKDATFRFLDELKEDNDLRNFAEQYQEEMFSRLKEKDKKALQRRIERYNKKHRCIIKLPNGEEFDFFEPQREVTLFGLISELRVVAPEILDLDILDYDDHKGIDLLVRRNADVSNMLERTKVAYTELKYSLERTINHPFENLHSVICWESLLSPNDMIEDPTHASFRYEESRSKDGVTYTHLVPLPGTSYSHNVKVIVLKRLLREKFGLREEENPTPISSRPSPAPGARGRARRR